jgi:hypothetical protein
MIIVVCPYCDGVSGRLIAYGHNETQPQAGDATLCSGCGEVSTFDFAEPGNLRRPTDAEQKEIDASDGIKLARAKIASREL